MFIFIDTETTGLSRYSYANQENYKKWPRLIQISWLLVDNEGCFKSEREYLIYPKNFTIPSSATQIHRITQEKAHKKGIPLVKALDELNHLMNQAHTIAAHNLSFDLGVIQSEAIRENRKLAIPENRLCTMYEGKSFLKQSKYPTLSFLYQKLFGFDYYPKHDAKSDVLACFHIFSKLKSLGHIN